MKSDMIKIGNLKLTKNTSLNIYDLSALYYSRILIRDIPLNCTLNITDTGLKVNTITFNKIADSLVRVTVSEEINNMTWDHIFSLCKYAEIKPKLISTHSELNPKILLDSFDGTIFQLTSSVDIDGITIDDVLNKLSSVWEKIDNSFYVCLQFLFNGVPNAFSTNEKKLDLSDLRLRIKNLKKHICSPLELGGSTLEEMTKDIVIAMPGEDVNSCRFDIIKNSDKNAFVILYQRVPKNEWKSPFSFPQYSLLKQSIIDSKSDFCFPVKFTPPDNEHFVYIYGTLIEEMGLYKIYEKAKEVNKDVEEKMSLFEKAADAYFDNLVKER